MDNYRIAVATADVSKVDQHFGSASRIVIYRTDGKTCVVEKEYSFDGGGKCTGDHADALARIEAVSQCRYIIAARVGSRIQKYFEANKQKYFEMPGHDTEFIIEKMTKYIQTKIALGAKDY